MSSLGVLEIAKIGLGENLTFQRYFRQNFPTQKIPDIWYIKYARLKKLR